MGAQLPVPHGHLVDNWALFVFLCCFCWRKRGGELVSNSMHACVCALSSAILLHSM
jgi:hypothetical protein